MNVCILRLKELSPNTKAQPVGWIIARNVKEAFIKAELIGETDLANKLRDMFNVGHGKYSLDDTGDAWLLVSI